MDRPPKHGGSSERTCEKVHAFATATLKTASLQKVYKVVHPSSQAEGVKGNFRASFEVRKILS